MMKRLGISGAEAEAEEERLHKRPRKERARAKKERCGLLLKLRPSVQDARFGFARVTWLHVLCAPPLRSTLERKFWAIHGSPLTSLDLHFIRIPVSVFPKTLQLQNVLIDSQTRSSCWPAQTLNGNTIFIRNPAAGGPAHCGIFDSLFSHRGSPLHCHVTQAPLV